MYNLTLCVFKINEIKIQMIFYFNERHKQKLNKKHFKPITKYSTHRIFILHYHGQ